MSMPTMKITFDLRVARIEMDLPLLHVVAGTLGAAVIVGVAHLTQRRRAALPPTPEPPSPELEPGPPR